MRPIPGPLAAAPAALALATLLALGGCGGSTERFPPPCPSLAILPDAADLTRYAAGGQDITDMVIDARITGVPASCVRDKNSKVRATLKVAMAVTRGPAATSRRAALPYFVAVMDGDTVLDKRQFVLPVEFPANATQAAPLGEAIDLLLPVTRDKSAAAYSIYVGYELTPEELALNRKRGAR